MISRDIWYSECWMSTNTPIFIGFSMQCSSFKTNIENIVLSGQRGVSPTCCLSSNGTSGNFPNLFLPFGFNAIWFRGECDNWFLYYQLRCSSWNPGWTSPEVQNRRVSDPTKKDFCPPFFFLNKIIKPVAWIILRSVHQVLSQSH